MIPKLFHLRELPHRTSHNIECHHHIACRLPSNHDYICTRPLPAIHQVADPGPPPHALVPTRQKGRWEYSSTAGICCARMVHSSLQDILPINRLTGYYVVGKPSRSISVCGVIPVQNHRTTNFTIESLNHPLLKESRGHAQQLVWEDEGSTVKGVAASRR